MPVVRSAREVAERCLVLRAVLQVVCGQPREQAVTWLRAESLWSLVSPDERRYLKKRKPDEDATRQMSWRSEALGALLWALGLFKVMRPHNKCFDSRKGAKVFPAVGEQTAAFRAGAKLRRKNEIEKACEAVYEAAWKINDATSREKPIPKGIAPDIVIERFHALNWLCGFGGDEWDEIELDT